MFWETGPKGSVRPLRRKWPVEVDVKVAPGFDRGRVVRDEDTHRQVHERRCEHDRGECTERPVIDLPIRPGRPPKGQMHGQNRQGPQNVDPVASVPSQEMGKGGEQAGIPAALIALTWVRFNFVLSTTDQRQLLLPPNDNQNSRFASVAASPAVATGRIGETVAMVSRRSVLLGERA